MTLYFRIKENGAAVFRIGDDSAQRRMTMTPVADVAARSGAIRARPGAALSDAETAEIEAWAAARRDALAAREAEDMRRVAEQINRAAGWYAGKPDPALADALAEDLLLAAHDLRAAIVRHRGRAD